MLRWDARASALDSRPRSLPSFIAALGTAALLAACPSVRSNVEVLHEDAGEAPTPSAVCGNGVRDPGESCDDGNLTSADGCSPSCARMRGFDCDDSTPNKCTPRCGDGVRIDEACDDGNIVDDDGCSHDCHVEAGWSCDLAAPSTCSALCGDGLIRGSETCDDRNTSPGDGCSPTCVRRDVWAPLSTTPLIQRRFDHAALWTGLEMFVWGGYSSELLSQGFVYNPSTEVIRVLSSQGAPAGYGEFRLFQRGSEVLVLGRQGFEGGLGVARYDLNREVWLQSGASSPLSAREVFAAVWTGSELIVWGGRDDAESALGDGARYNPVLDQWSPMNTAQAPSPRSGASAVWTGTELLIWGGKDNHEVLNDGARYDPTLDTWTPMASTSLRLQFAAASAVWTGSKMVVVDDYQGGQYDPSENTWQPIAPPPTSVARAKVAWTGSEVILWNDEEVAEYIPLIDSWRIVGPPPEPCDRCSLVWTGADAILWSGWTRSGARYRPATSTWNTFAFAISPPSNWGQTALWTGQEMITWGGDEREPVGGRYDPHQTTWAWTSAAGAPSARMDHTAVWTGSEMIVFGGRNFIDDQWIFFADGGRYRPDVDAWRPLETRGSASERAYASAIWTGSEMIVWGGMVNHDTRGDGVRFDPTQDVWRAMSNEGAPSPRLEAFMAWTGSEVLVWGGALSDIGGWREVCLFDGGLYDPVNDRWRPIPSGPRSLFQGGFAVWTGRELLLWDSGEDAQGVWHFDPSASAWTRVETPPPPLGSRTSYAAVWTGRDVVVWGGVDDQGMAFADGAIYNTAENSWARMPSAGAPSARERPLAVWTGSEMLIWGAGREGGRFQR